MSSTKPIGEKLGIRSGNRILLISSPPGFSIDPLPPGASVDYAPPADCVLLFVSTKAEFLDRMPSAANSLSKLGALWVAYPKGSKVELNRDSLRELGAGIGFDTVALFALDDTWTALRFKRS